MAATAQQPPLALDSVAYGQASGWRKGEDLMDALPYVDPLTAEEKEVVDKLVEEEMKRSTKRPADYLRELPPVQPTKFPGHPILQTEWDRLKRQEPMQPLDFSKFDLAEPGQTKKNDYAAWKAVLDDACASLEHQYNKQLNLELMLKFGPNAWRAHNDALAAHTARMEAEVAQLRAQTEAVNKQRKLAQVSAGRALAGAEAQWHAALRKNRDIEAACLGLEAEIERLRLWQAKINPDQDRPAGDAAAQAGGAADGQPPEDDDIAADAGADAQGAARQESAGPQQDETAGSLDPSPVQPGGGACGQEPHAMDGIEAVEPTQAAEAS